MPESEPTNAQIWREALLYAAIIALAGAAFVAARVAKDGDQVLTVTPHTSR